MKIAHAVRTAGFEDDFVTQALRASNKGMGDTALVPAVEVIGSQVAVIGLAREHMKGDDQQGMSYADRRPFAAAARRQPAGSQVVLSLSREGPGCLTQTASQRVTALSCLAA